MTSLCSVSDLELLANLSAAVRTERAARAEVIAHLAELDRRRLYLDQACSSLQAYCMQRLGYSEEGAFKRMRVARFSQRWPRVLEELRSGAIHLTGLFLLSKHVTDDNADELFAEARGKSRREIEELLAARFPRPDVLGGIAPVPVGLSWAAPSRPGTGDSGPTPPRPRLEPLSATSYRVEFTASAELRDKIERAKNLLSHALPNGDLAKLFERAIDQLIELETRRRSGTGRPRKRGAQKPGSRHVPLEVAQAVRARDGDQCSFVDEQGRRCTEKRFLTIEHDLPFALGGEAMLENLRLLCLAHNHYTARKVFGEAHIEQKRAEAEAKKQAQKPGVHDKVLAALVGLGFKRRPAESALAGLRARGMEAEPEPLLRAALAALTPG